MAENNNKQIIRKRRNKKKDTNYTKRNLENTLAMQYFIIFIYFSSY